ncbi:hypothetical protein Goklo_003543, partial [Gossypium klotzschianum]|nr:hypothetical protein [Gossypium klotzschianum]
MAVPRIGQILPSSRETEKRGSFYRN